MNIIVHFDKLKERMQLHSSINLIFTLNERTLRQAQCPKKSKIKNLKSKNQK